MGSSRDGNGVKGGRFSGKRFGAPEEGTAPEESAGPEESTAPEESAGPEESTASEENAGPEESTASEENAGPEESTASEENAGPEESAGPEEVTAPEESAASREIAAPERFPEEGMEPAKLSFARIQSSTFIPPKGRLRCCSNASSSLSSSTINLGLCCSAPDRLRGCIGGYLW